MLPTYALWESINECDKKSDLPDECWKVLRSISRRMAGYDFSTGNEKEVCRKILKALGYKSIKHFKDTSQLESNVKFLYDFAKQWNNEKYRMLPNRIFADRIPDRIFTKRVEVKLGNYPFSGLNLKRKFYAVVKTLGLVPLSKSGQFSPKLESLLLFFEDAMEEDETPLEAFLRWRRNHEAGITEQCQGNRRSRTPI